MAYEHEDHARTKRTNIYFNQSETELMAEWAKLKSAQKASLMRTKLVELAKAELSAFHARDRMTMLALDDLKLLG